MSEFKFDCPHCQQSLEAPEDMLGQMIECPSCNGSIQLPQPESQPAPAPIRDARGKVVQGKWHPKKTSDADEKHPAESTSVKAFDTYLKIAAWVAGGGLLLLALSPLFKWVNFGSGGVTGISGDGKIVLGLTVAAMTACGTAMAKERWLTPVLLGVQSWGTLAVFWMGALIWKVGSILGSGDMKDNPFAALLATQISPGAGLYLGLIGAVGIAGALGFIIARRSLFAGNLKPYYATQGLSCALGIVLALLVGPEGPSKPGSTDSPSSTTSAEAETKDRKPLSGILSNRPKKPQPTEPAIRGVELEPTLTGKRFAEEDFQEFVWLDVDWTAKTIKKPVRAVKGRLHISDLFGETKFAIGWTINRSIRSGDKFTEKGFGFKYNQFMDSHSWVRNTERDNMKLKFEVEAVVYQDGSMEGGEKNAPQNSVLIPTLLDKRFQKQDFQEFVWMDIEWDTMKLKKPTRAVKGVLHITDVFGNPQLSINSTIDAPLQPGKPYVEKGIGFKYNQFMDSHSWVLATSKENMRVVFVPKSIIYDDGAREDM